MRQVGVSATDPVQLAQDELHEALRAATLGEFEIYHVLGRGGMATVWLAHDIALDRPVAIKVMSPALLLQEGMADRFRREARTAASLNHPHIIPIYSVRQSERLLLFVMKYVEGRPLDQVIHDFPLLPFDAIQRILAQVASALGYAHRRGVVHRDVKPANIMIDVDGWAIVTDFGIARVADSPGLTSSGVAVGTPHYMSPEQYASQEITGRSDQFSLGVVAYEMIAGRLPFPGQTSLEVLRGHVLDTPPDARILRPECPVILADVVMRMLEKDPVKRWPSLEAAIAELRLPPAPEDDPVRTGLIKLARSGPQRLSVPGPPSSPIPPSGARIGLGSVGLGPSGAHTHWASPGRRVRWVASLILGATGLVVAFLLLNRVLRPRGSSGLATALVGAGGVDSTRGITVPPPPSPRTEARSTIPPREVSRVKVPVAGAKESLLTHSRARADTSDRPPPVGAVTEPRTLAQRGRSDSLPSDSASSGQVTGPAAPPWAWVRLGTKNELAFVYLNGRIQLRKGPPLQWWKVPAGRVAISVSAEGCTPWDTVKTLRPSDSLQIGNRQPQCGPPN